MDIRRVVKDWCYKHLYLKREPDLYIGGKEKPYLLRWYVLPRNPIFNVYYHIFLRSDYAEALHDHPWLFNASLILDGSYNEYVPGTWADDYSGIGRPDYFNTRKIERKEGDFAFRWGKAPHRVQLHSRETPCLASLAYPDLPFSGEELCSTLFITGPKIRKWGFYCPKGWKPWFNFLDKYESAHESIETKGCD